MAELSLAGLGSSGLECVVEVLGLYPAGREALKGIKMSEVVIRHGLLKYPPGVVRGGGGVRHPCCAPEPALSPCWGQTQG